MKKVKISLKFKILGGIILLLLLSIGSSIFFANDLISKDKKAYIYETGLREAESLSKQLLEQIRNTASMGVLYSVIDKVAPQKLEKLVNADKKLLLFSIYDNSDISQIKKTEMINDNLIEELSVETNIKIESLESEYLEGLVSKIRLSKRKLIIESFSSKLGIASIAILLRNDDSKEVYLFISSLKDISQITEDDKLFKKYIVDNKGHPYLSIRKNKEINLNKILKTKGYKGTTEISDKSKQIQMTSFVKYKEYNVNIISTISKRRALFVITDLRNRSLVFGLALLSLSIIFGILFASKISYPIKQLLSGTKKIAQGIFDEKILVSSKDELAVLADSFNFMSEEIGGLLQNKQVMIDELNIAKDQLEDYSKNLEMKVEERTASLKEANNFIEAMINSLDQGLMVFGKDSVCKPFFTSACIDMFGESPSGKPFYEVIDMKESDHSSFKSWNEIIFSEKLPFDSAKGLGPKNKITGNNYKEDGFKFISLEYFPMKNEEGNIANLVAVATDKTATIRAEEISKEKEAYSSMILRIINNKKQFISFMKESEAIVQNILKEFESEVPRPDYIMMNFHSLNGGFGIYHVEKLQVAARAVESIIADFKKDPSDESVFIQNINEMALNYKMEFLKFKDECALYVGGAIDEESENTVISANIKNTLYEKIEETQNDELKEYFKEYFVRTPVIDSFKAYVDLVESVSQTLNKSIAPINFDGAHMRLEISHYEDFFNTLVHLFRNCVDHGIEAPGAREAAGKNPEGVIGVSFDKVNQNGEDYLLVEVVDDGGGINPELIRNKLNSIDDTNDFSTESDEDIIYHIFDSSFSTRDEVSAISGRGVGMSAIKDIIEEKNGHIHLTSKVGSGSKFQFYLPFQ